MAVRKTKNRNGDFLHERIPGKVWLYPPVFTQDISIVISR